MAALLESGPLWGAVCNFYNCVLPYTFADKILSLDVYLLL